MSFLLVSFARFHLIIGSLPLSIYLCISLTLVPFIPTRNSLDLNTNIQTYVYLVLYCVITEVLFLYCVRGGDFLVHLLRRCYPPLHNKLAITSHQKRQLHLTQTKSNTNGPNMCSGKESMRGNYWDGKWEWMISCNKHSWIFSSITSPACQTKSQLKRNKKQTNSK